MIKWKYTDQDTFEMDDGQVMGTVVKIKDGDWFWEMTYVEEFISGPYPGTPDWKEETIGEGHVFARPGRTDDDLFLYVTAKWLAERAYARWIVKMGVYEEEEAAYYEQMADEEEAYRERKRNGDV